VTPPEQDPLTRNALVLIDELDAHMHPAWQQVVVHRLGEHFPNIQFVATTHSPLVVAGLDAKQVTRFRRAEDDAGGIIAEAPEHDLKGLGVAGLLTSDLFSLSSQLDPETEQALARKRALASRDQPSEDERAELGALDQRLGSVDFSTMVRDPLYPEFVRAMTELELEDAASIPSEPITPETQEQRRELARGVMRKPLSKEGTEGEGDEE